MFYMQHTLIFITKTIYSILNSAGARGAVQRRSQAGGQAGLLQDPSPAVPHRSAAGLQGRPTPGVPAGAQAGAPEKLPEHSQGGLHRGAQGGVPAGLHPAVQGRDHQQMLPAVQPLFLVQSLRVNYNCKSLLL